MIRLHCTDQVSGADLELDPANVNRGFRELGQYFFYSEGPAQQLYIDDAPIQAEPWQQRHGWVWRPGFYAGTVRMEWLDHAGQVLGQFQLDVAPDEGKLGADVFTQLIAQLLAFDPLRLFGTEAAQNAIGATGSLIPPQLAYARLHHYGMDLIRALQQISQTPLTRLRQQRTLLPQQRVRRLDAISVRGMLRHRETAALLFPECRSSGATMPGIDVSHSFDDLDNPPNQAISALLQAVRQRCRQVTAELQQLAGSSTDESETRTPLQPRLPRRIAVLQQLSRQFDRLSRRPPFAAVSRREISAAGLNAIAAHPVYARAHRFGWSIMRPGINGDPRAESLWMSPTWEIYENWCFSRLAICIKNQYAGLEWHWDRAASSTGCTRLTGTSDSLRVQLSLQCEFAAGNHPGKVFRSVSALFRPDLVLTLQVAGEPDRMLVLDAKYRSSRASVLDAMRSAHIYQDALRWNGRRALATLLLIPRSDQVQWLQDPAFLAEHRVGVQALHPGTELTELAALLERWFKLDPRPGGQPLAQ